MSDANSTTEAEATLAQFEPIVKWMRENGVKRFENGGFVLDLEDPTKEVIRLRDLLAVYKKTLVDHGLMTQSKYPYAIPGMPDVTPQIEDDR